MAQTKVKLISDGVIDVDHLASGHGITTDNIGEGSNLYYTDARVSTYLSTNSYATEGYVTTAVSDLVAAAPSTLDTLNELAAALGDDPNFATTVTNSIATKLPLAGGTLTGNLGIGGSPSQKLDVRGNIKIDGANNGNVANFIMTRTDASWRIANETDFRIYSGGGNTDAANNLRMQINSAGNTSFTGSVSSNTDVRSQRLVLRSDALERWEGTGDEKAVTINYFGYNTTFDYYRDLNIYNGKGGFIATFDGSSSNVGIGTTSPDKKLHVDGGDLKVRDAGNVSIQIVSSTSDNSAIQFGDDSDVNDGRIVYENTGNNMLFYTNDAEKMRITSGGDVGIGTASPAYKLQVDGNTGVRNGSFFIGDETGSTNSAIEFYKSGTTLRLYTNTGAFGGTYAASAANIDLYSGGAYSTRISGDSNSYFGSGNVGIGLTNPSYKLHVAGNGFFDDDVVVGNGSSDLLWTTYSTPQGAYSGSFGWNSLQLGNNGGNFIMAGNNAGGGTLGIYTNVSSRYRYGVDQSIVGTLAAWFDANGNMGVGTSTPKTQFHINSGGSYNNTDQNNRLLIERNSHAYILYSVPDGFDSGIHFHNTTDNAFVGRIAYSHNSGGDTMSFRVGTSSGSGHVFFTNNKRVGIGNASSPSSTLHVSDSIAGNVAITIQNQDGARSSQLRFLSSGGTEKTALTFVPTDTSFRLYHNGADNFCITSNGEMSLGDDDTYAISTDRINSIGNINRAGLGSSAYARLVMQERTGNWISFVNGTPVHYGTISVSGSGVSYGSNSDYRLKENILDLTSSIDKVKLLSPKTFNFVSNPEQNVTGFIAHEVQEVIPEAVVGEKDGVVVTGNIVEDATGKLLEVNVEQPETLEDGTSFVVTKTEPKYQQLDPAKLVAVLTGAIKELVEKVEYLENEINSIKNG